MRGLLIAVSALGACLALGGCSTANTQNLDDFITTMSKTNCHVVISTAASVGAMNPLPPETSLRMSC